MSEIVYSVGRLNKGEYWILDRLMDVQVGWITKSDEDRKWYIFDSGYTKQAGPFDTLKASNLEVKEALKHEFGTSSISN